MEKLYVISLIIKKNPKEAKSFEKAEKIYDKIL